MIDGCVSNDLQRHRCPAARGTRQRPWWRGTEGGIEATGGRRVGSHGSFSPHSSSVGVCAARSLRMSALTDGGGAALEELMR